MKHVNIASLLTVLVTYVDLPGAAAKSSSHKESSSSQAKLSTLTLPIPHFANAFTETIKGCHDDPTVVVVGEPSGSLEAGTTTAFLPPQASALTTTYVDKTLKLTEVIIATPLPGSCASLSIPAEATKTVSANPAESSGPAWGGPDGWNSSSTCPTKGCSSGVDRSAQIVIISLNEITYAVQRLQAAAERLEGLLDGGRAADLDESVRPDVLERFSVIHDFIIPLKDIPAAIFYIIPRLEILVAFPKGCDTDTIVFALADLVDVYVSLLDTLEDTGDWVNGGGRYPREVVDTPELTNTSDDAEYVQFVPSLIVATLKSTLIAVDLLAWVLIGLLPTRRKCIDFLVQKLGDALSDAIAAWE